MCAELSCKYIAHKQYIAAGVRSCIFVTLTQHYLLQDAHQSRLNLTPDVATQHIPYNKSVENKQIKWIHDIRKQRHFIIKSETNTLYILLFLNIFYISW